MNVAVNYKSEGATFGVAPGATGAKKFRLNAGAGLKMGRGLIQSNEIRSDGQSSMGRLGGRAVSGSYSADLSQGTFDELIEAAFRGTWSSGSLLPGTTPAKRSFTFEQYLQDNDTAELFTGCRVNTMKVTLAPDGMAGVEFGIDGTNMTLLTGAAAPYFTSPTESTTGGMVAVDAAITLGGVSTLDFTACDFTLDLHGSSQRVIGSTISPDVYQGNMTLAGSITALRSSAARQQAYLDETEVALILALAVPSPGTGSLTFTLGKIKFTDFSASLGGDGAMLVQLPFMAGKDATLGGMIRAQTTV